MDEDLDDQHSDGLQHSPTDRGPVERVHDLEFSGVPPHVTGDCVTPLAANAPASTHSPSKGCVALTEAHKHAITNMRLVVRHNCSVVKGQYLRRDRRLVGTGCERRNVVLYPNASEDVRVLSLIRAVSLARQREQRCVQDGHGSLPASYKA